VAGDAEFSWLATPSFDNGHPTITLR